MANLIIMIECMDTDSAAKLQEAIKKNTIGYDTSVIQESSGNTGIRDWLELSLTTDLPTFKSGE